MISKSPTLYADIASGLRTNLTLSQVVQLAVAAQGIPKENIKQAVIGTEYTQIAMSVDWLSILHEDVSLCESPLIQAVSMDVLDRMGSINHRSLTSSILS
jgi:hypothetical protein